MMYQRFVAWFRIALLSGCVIGSVACAEIFGIPETSLGGDAAPDGGPDAPRTDAGAGSDGAAPDADPAPACAPAPLGILAWWDGEMPGQPGRDRYGDVDSSGGVGTVTTAPGQVGNAIRFDGNSYLDFDPSPTPPQFTVEGWIFLDSQVDDWIAVYGRLGESSVCTYDHRITFWESDAAMPEAEDGNLAHGMIRLGGRWQHIATTWDGTTIRTYVDGAADGATTTDVVALPNRAQMGGLRTFSGTGVQDPFIGLIDELTLYSRALSQSEIQAIVDAGSAGKCDP